MESLTNRLKKVKISSARKSVSNESIGKNFQDSRRTSQWLFQFECSCNPKRWWGTNKNNKCFKCKKIVNKLLHSETIGIGWFRCQCSRLYAGFCRGDVASKCHGCQAKNLPLFIVPGLRADKNEKTDKSHHCELCLGDRDSCPIVAEAIRIHSKLLSKK